MSMQEDVDARYMKVHDTATIADLERGAAYCDHLIATSSLVYTRQAKRELWRHHAELLRAEIAKRQAEAECS